MPSTNSRPTEDLIACPACDALHRVDDIPIGSRTRCTRCHDVLISPRDQAFSQVIALSVAVAVLMIGAIFFPFLGIAAKGLSHASSVLEVALAFSDGILAPLSLLVITLIVLIPLVRAAAVTYALWPLAHGRPGYRHAASALRMSEFLRPWSMAEIFMIGTAVALVKVAGLASISLGPAFWAFCAMVIVVALSDNFMCKWTIWKTLDTNRMS
ncbi:MAG: paraquat-inducible protein A [Deltaproteobacteria bacterium]